MAAFPQVTIFFLVSSIGILTAFAAGQPPSQATPTPLSTTSYGVLQSPWSQGAPKFSQPQSLSSLVQPLAMKPHDFSRWPPPPCKLYYPTDPLYQLDEPECPNVTAYVCAQDGHTYQNECFFCVARWEFGPRIKFDKYGKCG